MKNQFYYTIETKTPAEKEGEEEVITKTMGSFNMEKVNVTVEYEPNKLLVMLDDYHNQFETVRMPLFNKQGEHNRSFKLEYREVTVNAQIRLNEEDTKRYIQLTEVK